LGKAILAHLDVEDVLASIRERGWRPYTQRSIRDEATLVSQLEQVRAQGYAVDLEERRTGVCCVAAPIFDRARHVVAAVSVSTRVDRHDEPRLRSELAPPVMAAADRISYALGDPDSRAYL
jgi:IclR family acetate operon transcriptional repressor